MSLHIYKVFCFQRKTLSFHTGTYRGRPFSDCNVFLRYSVSDGIPYSDCRVFSFILSYCFPLFLSAEFLKEAYWFRIRYNLYRCYTGVCIYVFGERLAVDKGYPQNLRTLVQPIIPQTMYLSICVMDHYHG